jgi:hypothetical protein
MKKVCSELSSGYFPCGAGYFGPPVPARLEIAIHYLGATKVGKNSLQKPMFISGPYAFETDNNLTRTPAEYHA